MNTNTKETAGRTTLAKVYIDLAWFPIAPVNIRDKVVKAVVYSTLILPANHLRHLFTTCMI
jgi:hypothetical protein